MYAINHYFIKIGVENIFKFGFFKKFAGFTDDEEEENPVRQEPVEEITDSPDDSPDLVNKNHYWNQLQTEQNNLPSEGLQNVRNYSVTRFDHQILQNR